MATANANTGAIGDQIVTFLASLTYPGTSTVVYDLAQLEAIKDVTDLVANGGICCEVYGDQDTSERRGFGGRIWDEQSWFILSLCSLDTPALARKIYDVRDAMVYPFQQHATLGTAVFNLFHAQLQPNMKFFRVLRNGVWLRAHLAQLTTKQEWQVIGGIIS
jgi:hypothetical protein